MKTIKNFFVSVAAVTFKVIDMAIEFMMIHAVVTAILGEE